MVVDTSAAFAVLADEEDADAFKRALERASSRVMSAMTELELRVAVICRFGLADAFRVDTFLRIAQIDVVPFDADAAKSAAAAYARWGRTFHPAGLNYGDCASYALAETLNEPLLFKGDDFSKTDIKVALEHLGDE
jgi:ribonuclease VapC